MDNTTTANHLGEPKLEDLPPNKKSQIAVKFPRAFIKSSKATFN